VISTLPTVTPAFELQIAWARDYDELFKGQGEAVPEAGVLERAIQFGRCIISGRGGSGKTQMLLRLMRRAFDSDMVPILINLKDWTGPDYAAWDEWTATDIGAGATFLLERFSQPRTDALSLDSLPPSTQKLLIVDGLNEIAAPIGQQILIALDEISRDQVRMSVVIADRLTRRELRSPLRWALGSTLPLSQEQIGRYVDAGKQLASDGYEFGTPYFLDAVIRNGTLGVNAADTHRRFLSDHGRLSDAELDELAEAAFETYRDARTRSFPLGAFTDRVGTELARRLVDERILLKGAGDEAHFAHHLLHDYLSARHVARLHDEAWAAPVFRAISFDGGSFDTISMVFSMLDVSRADIFLRRVYDWNPYAAAYALSDSPPASEGPSREIQIVILAMLAEKMFDIVEPTAQRALDALALIHTPDAAQFRRCESLDEVLVMVRQIGLDATWFAEWQRVFTYSRDQAASDEDLRRIDGDDSIVGWTVANVLKRLQMAAHQQAWLRERVSEAGATARWRIVHVLGSFPSIPNLAVLSNLLAKDPDDYVRYGAVRSIVEMAARGDESLRDAAAAALEQNADSIASDTKVKDELKRALRLRRDSAPHGWLNTIKRACQAVYQADDSLAGRDEWREYIAEITILFREAA
jgi:hypothetical protein